ncbi:hypothetical protein [Caulobacter segnis]|nr:hypothetical protein [Caulobacter segnis]MDR6626153.1 hypothetical protein [Caulobacter segnis]
MALLDHHRSEGRQHPAGSALCLGVTIAGLIGLAIMISWLMTFVTF